MSSPQTCAPSNSKKRSTASSTGVLGTVALAVTIAAGVGTAAGSVSTVAMAHSHNHRDEAAKTVADTAAGHTHHDHDHDDHAAGAHHNCAHHHPAARKAIFGFHKLPSAEADDSSSATTKKKAGLTVVELERRKASPPAAAGGGGGAPAKEASDASDEILTVAVVENDGENDDVAGGAEGGQFSSSSSFVSFKHHQAQRHKRQLQKRGFAPAADTTAQPLRIVFKTHHLDDGLSYCTNAMGTSRDMINSGVDVKCTKYDVFTEAQRLLLRNDILPRVANVFGKYLKVMRSSTGKVSVPKGVCGEKYEVSDEDTNGVEGDMIIYVSAAPTRFHYNGPLPTLEGVTAVGNMCALNKEGRPVIGFLNISPRFVSADNVASVVKAVGHEVLHALGFTPSYFNSDAVKTSGLISTGETRRGGQPVTLFKGPATLAAAKAHFGCDSLTGVELENDPTNPYEPTGHWERRLFRDDVMSSHATKVMAFSELSLAALEDTGHYFVNRDVDLSNVQGAPAGTLAGVHTKGFQVAKYLYRQGCGVHNSKCNTVEGGAGSQFCFERNKNKPLCTDDKTSIGTCRIATYTYDLPKWARFFENEPRVGGVESFNDYCPVVHPTEARQCNNFKNSLSNDTAQGFYYGDDGRCFATSDDFAQSGVRPLFAGARCLRTRCAKGTLGTYLEIQVGNSPWRSCPLTGREGTVSAPDGYSGTVVCPAASTVCPYDIYSVVLPTTTAGNGNGNGGGGGTSGGNNGNTNTAVSTTTARTQVSLDNIPLQGKSALPASTWGVVGTVLGTASALLLAAFA